MPNFTLPTASLKAAIPVFYRYGLHDTPDTALTTALHTTESPT